jgi:hypothetical protein
MPIEIRELTIKVTVDQPNPQAQQSAGNTPGEGAKDDKDSILSQCVEQVLSIMKNKKER